MEGDRNAYANDFVSFNIMHLRTRMHVGFNKWCKLKYTQDIILNSAEYIL